MNGYLRCEKALSNAHYDYVSPCPAIDASYAAKALGVKVGECFLDESLHAKALEHVFRIHDVDGVYINLCLSKKQIKECTEGKTGWRIVDTFGDVWNVPHNDVASKIEYSIKDFSDERLLTENPLKEGIIDTFKKIRKDTKAAKMITPGLTGPFSQLVMMMGMSPVMIEMMDEPERLKELISLRTRLAIDWADELIDNGARFIWIGEGPASSSVISPGQYREFVLPYEQQVTRHIKERGAFGILHICGNINPSLEYVASCGASGVDLDHMVDIVRAKEIMKDVCCVKGNINPVDLVTKKSEDIYSKCSNLIKLFGNKGFILSTGCLVSRDTPAENIDAMCAASKDSEII